jgi:predicted enzyme related to lactoylglutathione lyase
MSERTHYPAGVPCWVDTLQPDVERATQFYAELFGWEIAGPGKMPNGGAYFVARCHGGDVAGIASQPPQRAAEVSWNTHVAVARADETAERVRDAGGTIIVDAFDALPAGRMAVASDPAGASFCLWEARDRHGAQRINEPGAWAMSVLLTRDLEGSQRFYGDVFGWQTIAFAGGDEVRLFRLPGYVGGEPQQPVPRDVVAAMASISPNDFAADAPPRWSVDFWIDDVDATARRAAALGGNVIVPPHETTVFRRTILADPGGAIFSLSQAPALR